MGSQNWEGGGPYFRDLPPPSFFVFILKMRVVLNLLPEVSWSVFSPLTIVIKGRALVQTIKGVMVLRF